MRTVSGGAVTAAHWRSGRREKMSGREVMDHQGSGTWRAGSRHSHCRRGATAAADASLQEHWRSWRDEVRDRSEPVCR